MLKSDKFRDPPPLKTTSPQTSLAVTTTAASEAGGVKRVSALILRTVAISTMLILILNRLLKLLSLIMLSIVC